MNNSKNLANAIKQAIEDYDFWRHEFVTPEHVLYAFASQEQFASASEWLPHDTSWLITQLEKEFLSMEVVPETHKYVIEGSQQFSEMMSLAIKQAQYSDQDTLDVPHVVAAMLMLNDSQAAYPLDQFTGDEKGEFMQSLVSAYAETERAKRLTATTPTPPHRGASSSPASTTYTPTTTRSSVAKPNWSAPCRCSAARTRTTRCTWASRAWVRRRSSTDSPPS